MVYLIFYDISSDRLRNKIARLLESTCYERLQYSVFTGLDNPDKNIYLWSKIHKILSAEHGAKFYVIPVRDEQFCAINGFGIDQLDIDYLAGVKSSLII